MVKSVLDTTRTDGGRREEIFVDIVEKLTCTFNSSGYLQGSQIDGAIVVRHEGSAGPSLLDMHPPCASQISRAVMV